MWEEEEAASEEGQRKGRDGLWTGTGVGGVGSSLSKPEVGCEVEGPRKAGVGRGLGLGFSGGLWSAVQWWLMGH